MLGENEQRFSIDRRATPRSPSACSRSLPPLSLLPFSFFLPFLFFFSPFDCDAARSSRTSPATTIGKLLMRRQGRSDGRGCLRFSPLPLSFLPFFPFFFSSSPLRLARASRIVGEQCSNIRGRTEEVAEQVRCSAGDRAGPALGLLPPSFPFLFFFFLLFSVHVEERLSSVERARRTCRGRAVQPVIGFFFFPSLLFPFLFSFYSPREGE